MATYITDLITNDRESFDQLVLLLRYLSSLDVDLRQLSQLRSVYYNKEKKQLKAVSFEELQTAMMGIFHHYRQCSEIAERIVSYLKSKADLTDAPYERVNTMIEFVQCYPIIVKKDKNASPGMSLVLTNEAYFVDKEIGGASAEQDDEQVHQ